MAPEYVLALTRERAARPRDLRTRRLRLLPHAAGALPARRTWRGSARRRWRGKRASTTRTCGARGASGRTWRGRPRSHSEDWHFAHLFAPRAVVPALGDAGLPRALRRRARSAAPGGARPGGVPRNAGPRARAGGPRRRGARARGAATAPTTRWRRWRSRRAAQHASRRGTRTAARSPRCPPQRRPGARPARCTATTARGVTARRAGRTGPAAAGLRPRRRTWPSTSTPPRRVSRGAVERRGGHVDAGVARPPAPRIWRPLAAVVRAISSTTAAETRRPRPRSCRAGRAGLRGELRAVPRRGRRRATAPAAAELRDGAHRLPPAAPQPRRARFESCAKASRARRWRRGRRGSSDAELLAVAHYVRGFFDGTIRSHDEGQPMIADVIVLASVGLRRGVRGGVAGAAGPAGLDRAAQAPLPGRPCGGMIGPSSAPQPDGDHSA